MAKWLYTYLLLSTQLIALISMPWVVSCIHLFLSSRPPCSHPVSFPHIKVFVPPSLCAGGSLWSVLPPFFPSTVVTDLLLGRTDSLSIYQVLLGVAGCALKCWCLRTTSLRYRLSLFRRINRTRLLTPVSNSSKWIVLLWSWRVKTVISFLLLNLGTGERR